jgi:acetylornithine deacetylase
MANPSIPSSGATSPVSLLRDLVEIDSVNPSMAAGPGEAELARYVADFGHSRGLQVTVEDALPGRPNVTVTLPANASTRRVEESARERDRRRLLFDVHLDTVPPGDMPGPFSARIVGDRLWGRGACDTKASLAAALAALDRLAREPAERSGEVCLLGTVDEEFQKRGVEFAVRQGLRAEAAVVGEPTMMQPVIAHKGALRWRVITVGKAAHTSRPQDGNNAIYQMLEVIQAIRQHLEPRLASLRHPLLTPPTLTVSRIQGGVAVNVVPDRCAIEIDRRTLPSEDLDELLADVDRALEDLSAVHPWIAVQREAPFLAERGFETAPASAVVLAALRACRAEMGGSADIALRGAPYGTDATFLAGPAGIPTVVLGPGDVAQAHTVDEWVHLDQVERAAGTYYRLMKSFATGDW